MAKDDRKAWRFGLYLIICLTALAGAGQQNGVLPFSHYKLKNGLEVILSEDSSLPLVSVAITYKVGSLYESPGKTGLAYLMENLMFSGSTNISPLQHINYIHRIGGKFNASTYEDRTLFYQTVPSNQLALVLWLESDRMSSLELDETAFEQARNTLLEELRQRKANEPYLESFFSFDELLYSDFAFSHPLLGSAEDLQSLTLEDAKNFYSTFYTPNNAVLCIAGNFNKLKARELVSRYFETIPRGKEIAPAFEPWMYPKRQAIKTYEESLASAPAFHLGFRLASPSSDDFYTLSLLDFILLRGRSSRITKRLLDRDNKIAYQLSGGIEKRNNRAVLKIFVTVNNPTMADRCLKAVFSELDRLKTTFLSDGELAKYKNMFKQDYLGRLSSSMEKAIFLNDAYLTLKNFDDLPLELDKYMKITPSDVVGIVNRYFALENSIILNVITK